jgi:hypothetical protein
MRKIKRSDIKSNASYTELKKTRAPKTAIMNEDKSVQDSKKTKQNNLLTDNSYKMSEVPQAQTKDMKRALTNPETGDELQGEEFHWMASAAYNQS